MNTNARVNLIYKVNILLYIKLKFVYFSEAYQPKKLLSHGAHFVPCAANVRNEFHQTLLIFYPLIHHDK